MTPRISRTELFGAIMEYIKQRDEARALVRQYRAEHVAANACSIDAERRCDLCRRVDMLCADWLPGEDG